MTTDTTIAKASATPATTRMGRNGLDRSLAAAPAPRAPRSS